MPIIVPLPSLETIKQLIEFTKEAMPVIRRGKVKREKFFNDRIKPIHESFREMRKNHLDTFAYVENAFLKKNCDVRKLLFEVNQRNGNETSNWELFKSLDDFAKGVSVSFGKEFADYCTALTECLCSSDLGRYNQIMYYKTLTDRLRWTVESLGAEKVISQEIRDDAIQEIGRLRDEFNYFCQRVETSYAKLDDSIKM